MTRGTSLRVDFRARPVSHWQFATLMDIRSGTAARRARELKTSTLRILNAQTASSLFYSGWVAADRDGEPYITDAGETLVEHMTGDGRYRARAADLTATVQRYARKGARILHLRRKAAAA